MVIVGKGTKEDPIILEKLTAEEVPPELRPENFFDLDAHEFEHRGLIDQAKSVVDIINKNGIEKYAIRWLINKFDQPGIGVDIYKGKPELPIKGSFGIIKEEGAFFKPSFVVGSIEGVINRLYMAKDAVIAGASIYLDKGDIYIGEGTVVESGAGIKGPAIIGKRNEIRQGAYLRGNVIVGDQRKFGDNALRGELKNVLMLDEANFPHPSYLGDSVCGYNTHMGNEVTAANLGIIQGIRDRNKRLNLKVEINGKWYDLGMSKMGVVLGDKTQLGCETMIDPGTFLGPMCVSYGLASIPSGYYPAGTMFKTRAHKFADVEPGKFELGRL